MSEPSSTVDSLARVSQNWDDLAELDPVWFTVPSSQFAGGRANVDDFMESGRAHVRADVAALAEAGITWQRGAALDFGCGLGRITQALAAYFDECYGVDISPKMVEHAGRLNRMGRRCRFLANTRPDLRIFDDGTFDFVYSENTLQHVPPDVIKQYLAEFARVLRPGGVLVFQVPLQLPHDEHTTELRKLPRYHPRRIVNKLEGIVLGHGAGRYYRLRKLGVPKKWLHRHFGLHPQIDMYSLSMSDVRDFAVAHACSMASERQYRYRDCLHGKFALVKSQAGNGHPGGTS